MLNSKSLSRKQVKIRRSSTIAEKQFRGKTNKVTDTLIIYLEDLKNNTHARYNFSTSNDPLN